MNIVPRIEFIAEKRLIGHRLEMSLLIDKTAQLWSRFMPRRNEIDGRVGSDFISMQMYNRSKGSPLAADTLFEKSTVVPEGMECHRLNAGKYAVFDYQGPASGAPDLFRFIFMEWLPKTDFEIDNREHFEVLGEGYSPNDPAAQEAVWIPIK
jgi:AraC family transcriptional regulator